jgi:hypothetical protein
MKVNRRPCLVLLLATWIGTGSGPPWAGETGSAGPWNGEFLTGLVGEWQGAGRVYGGEWEEVGEFRFRRTGPPGPTPPR